MAEHDGHRQRLIEKLYNSQLEDHEVLEVLLFNAMPRRNTSDIAHALLGEFGSILSLFAATKAELKKVPGVGDSVAAYLYCLGEIFNRYFVDRHILSLPEHYSPEGFAKVLTENYREARVEMFDVYFLDGDAKVLDYRRYSSQKVDEISLDLDIFARVVENAGARGAAIVHNHPNGIYGPSAADDEATVQMLAIFRKYDMSLWDHMVLSRAGAYSYFSHGRFPFLREIAMRRYPDLNWKGERK